VTAAVPKAAVLLLLLEMVMVAVGQRPELLTTLIEIFLITCNTPGKWIATRRWKRIFQQSFIKCSRIRNFQTSLFGW
jgi:hypothetical protein